MVTLLRRRVFQFEDRTFVMIKDVLTFSIVILREHIAAVRTLRGIQEALLWARIITVRLVAVRLKF